MRRAAGCRVRETVSGESQVHERLSALEADLTTELESLRADLSATDDTLMTALE